MRTVTTEERLHHPHTLDPAVPVLRAGVGVSWCRRVFPGDQRLPRAVGHRGERESPRPVAGASPGRSQPPATASGSRVPARGDNALPVSCRSGDRGHSYSTQPGAAGGPTHTLVCGCHWLLMPLGSVCQCPQLRGRSRETGEPRGKPEEAPRAGGGRAGRQPAGASQTFLGKCVICARATVPVSLSFLPLDKNSLGNSSLSAWFFTTLREGAPEGSLNRGGHSGRDGCQGPRGGRSLARRAGNTGCLGIATRMPHSASVVE